MPSRFNYFVGREEEIEVFSKMVNSAQGGNILVLQGPEGIGKTTLLDKFEHSCTGSGVRYAHVDFFTRREYSSYPNFLSAATDLWRQLALGTLEELNQLITTFYLGNGRAGRAEPATVPLAAAYAQVATPVFASGGPSIEGQIEDIGANAQAAIGNNIVQVQGQFNQIIRHDDAAVIEPLIRKHVTEAVRSRLKQITLQGPTVIFFDSWEAILTDQNYLKDPGAWLCDDLLRWLDSREITNCFAVIASAKEPRLGQLMRNVRRISLGPLPAAAAREYFSRVTVYGPESEILEQLVQISQGIPLAMELLADGANRHEGILLHSEQPESDRLNSQRVIGYAIDRYLDSLPMEIVEAIRIGAIPHRLNHTLLEEMGVTEPTIDELLHCSLVFVDADQEHFTYHPGVRNHLLTWWDAQDFQRTRQYSRKALGYFLKVVATMVEDEEPVYAYEREVFYHQLIEDEAAGFAYLLEKFDAACDDYALDRAQGFVEHAVELHQRNLLSDEGRMWLDYFLARLKLLRGEDDIGEAIFAQLADQARDRFLQGLAIWNLGNVRVEQNRWSEGVRLYRTSLDRFESLYKQEYAICVMVAMGEAYCDLAQASGGLNLASPAHENGADHFVYIARRLPFLAYQSLVRRLGFLPNWYFGTNYQNWITAYLLMEGAKWYRRAEAEQAKGENSSDLFNTQLLLAQIDHRLNRWSRARQRYRSLTTSVAAEDQGRRYQRAQIALGYGELLFDEQEYDAAETNLLDALDTFKQYEDNRSAGAAAELLGKLYGAQRQPEKAMSAYMQSVSAYCEVADHLAATRTLSILEDFYAQKGLSDPMGSELNRLSGEIKQRDYLLRFPDRLLRWFRRLALAGALPLTYLATLFLGLAILLTSTIAEGETILAILGVNSGTAINDIIFLVVAATLPAFVIVWFYQLIYTFVGMIVVHFLGRRLSPIEREQPRLITCTDTSIVSEDPRTSSKTTIDWTDVDTFCSMHYSLHQHPIELISSFLVTSKSGKSLVVEGVTSGYRHLIQEVDKHLRSVQSNVQNEKRDFIFFEKRWILAATVAVAVIAVYLVVNRYAGAEYTVTEEHVTSIQIGPDSPDLRAGETIYLPLTSLLAAFLPLWIFFSGAVILWRLVVHQIRLQRLYRRERPSIPVWGVALGASGLTVLALLSVILRVMR
jgi:hypothetical protein